MKAPSLLLLASVALLAGAPGHAQSSDFPVHFLESARQSGILFQHRHGGRGKKYLVETMGSGVCLLDYNRDGLLDLYFVQSGPHQPPRPPNQLYRNLGGGRFELAASSGAEDRSYGMGCSCADYDNDGWTDIYVTNFGPNLLLRNRGDGTFEDATRRSGTGDDSWSVSAAFADVDSDGRLDLYVANYVAFSYRKHVICGDVANPSYCHPDVYDALANSFYRNLGGGVFRLATRQAGLIAEEPAASKSLGVLWLDMDNDGDPDLYVANDSTSNYLFENIGRGRFRDHSLLGGAAYNMDGKTEAGMGVDAAEIFGSGRQDLVVSNLDFETNTVYRNEGGGLFTDSTEEAAAGGPSRTRVGFGVNLADFNNDGYPDLLVANGHVIDTISRENPTLSHAQPNQLLLQQPGHKFRDVSLQAGLLVQKPNVSRGSAVGDIDNDGDLDIIISNNNSTPELLINEGNRGHWIQLLLQGRDCNSEAIGARVRLFSGGRSLNQEVRAGNSYASSSDPRLHFGLGRISAVDSIEIRWPCGRIQKISHLAADRLHRVIEPE